MNRNTFIMVALNAALAFFCVTRTSAQAWLPGSNGSIYNPNLSTGGYVGIGTNNPTATLEIANTPNHTFNAGVIGNRANTNIQMLGSAAVIAPGITDNSSVGAVAWDFFNNGNNPSWSGAILDYYGAGMTGTQNGVLAANQGSLVFQNVNSGVISSNGANIFISPLFNVSTCFLVDGSVGIGTTDTKGYKFAVNGSSVFTKVVVKAVGSWPDYVFDSTYQLRPLEKVEQYIRDNHHLPEIPSADSVEKAGIDVGANQATLLKKVEELTLYMIGQQQQLDRLTEKDRHLEKEHHLLKTKYQQLQKRITDLKRTTR
jgi:hypothetical protein